MINLKTLIMKKYLLTFITAISIGVIATSATNVNLSKHNSLLAKTVMYDTVPESNNNNNNNKMDTSGKWKNNKMKNHKNNNRDSSSGMHNMDSTANPPR